MLKDANIAISMTEKGDPYENAIAERVNGILKSEFHLNKIFRTPVEAQIAVQNSVTNYNSIRPHMNCNYLTPQQAHQKVEPLIKKWKNKGGKDIQYKEFNMYFNHSPPSPIRRSVYYFYVFGLDLSTSRRTTFIRTRQCVNLCQEYTVWCKLISV